MAIELPVKRRSLGGAEFDPGACMKAVRVLKIEAHVQVKWSNGWRTRGRCAWRNGQHVITVSTHLNSEEASRTLWHELAHAAQRERLGEFFWDRYKMYGQSGYAYHHTNPFEEEARRFSDEFHPVLPLTKAT